jgi:hypothetical protein
MKKHKQKAKAFYTFFMIPFFKIDPLYFMFIMHFSRLSERSKKLYYITNKKLDFEV